VAADGKIYVVVAVFWLERVFIPRLAARSNRRPSIMHDLPSVRENPAPAPRIDRACRLVEWTPWPFENPSLLGHVSVSFPGGWQVHRIPVFRAADGGLSVGVPSAAEIDRDGHIKLRDGKREYQSVITFETNDARGRWRRMIMAALAEAGVGSRGNAP
jgi:hypothetical protein